LEPQYDKSKVSALVAGANANNALLVISPTITAEKLLMSDNVISKIYYSVKQKECFSVKVRSI